LNYSYRKAHVLFCPLLMHVYLLPLLNAEFVAGAPVPSVSQTMSGTLTVPAKIYGAAVAAVSQAVNLTSHAENAGISAVTNAGTNKVLSSENSNLRKHPRTEQAAFEQGPRPKTQRSSGAFGEACLAGIVLEDPKHEVEQS
uniref:VAN3-binding protein-like auxin canalisation domain-containing protein n=1 Tax=Aegilops tauschii subsp. strangulata TaxID=200361 RepID=A0A453J4H9_AEGTS